MGLLTDLLGDGNATSLPVDDGALEPYPTPHPTPPTITLGTTSAPVLTGGAYVTTSNLNAFRHFGAAVQFFSGYAHGASITSAGAADSADRFQTFHTEFYFDGNDIELQLRGFGGSYRILVDDQWAATDDSAKLGPAPDGSPKFLRLTFASRAIRKIRVELGTQPFAAAYVKAGDSVWPTPPAEQRMIVVGDSFTRDDRVTGQYSQRLTAFPFALGKYLGLRDVWASGVGSTGYLKTTADPRVKFRDRLQADVLDHAPDIIVWAGGHNDGTFSTAAIQDEAEACYEAAAAALPGVRQIVCSPFNNGGTVAAPRPAVSAAIEAAAVANGLPFIDVLDPNIWSGTGKVGTPAGNGNADYYVSPDAVHPSADGAEGGGHRWLGMHLARLIKPHLSAA